MNTQDTSAESFDGVLVAKPEAIANFSSKFLSGLSFKPITSGAEVDAFFDAHQLPAGMPVLVLSGVEGMGVMEIGQAFNSYYQGIRLMLALLGEEQRDLKGAKKNGFSDIYILPLDTKYLESALNEVRARKSGQKKLYKAVKMVDLEAGDELQFGVMTYLPLNKKYVPLTAAGAISEKKVESLKQKGVNSLFVDQKDVGKFYEYSAQKLAKSIDSNDAVSATERQEKVKATVRELFRSFLSQDGGTAGFEEGRDLMEQSVKIVETYVIDKTGVDLKERFRSIVGEGEDFYGHAQLVSTIAALLSLASGIGKPEDLAIAGLFHDIGLDRVETEVSIFDWQDLEPAEKELYRQHPKSSVNILKDRRVTLVPSVVEMIEKHHERVDGKGFPGGLPAHKIPLEAQLLAYADAFEYLSRRVPGQPLATPIEIHGEISKKLSLSPDLLLKVQSFIKEMAT